MESGATTAPSRAASPASASPPQGSCASLCEPSHRFLRKDRELMRKSALLRRFWAKPNCNPCPSCCYCSSDICDNQGECGRETRSLDGSRSELRHLTSIYNRNSKESQLLNGWSTPKRQRLESPNNFHSSDEMLRTAMRNSYDRAEEIRIEKEGRDVMSDSTSQSQDLKTSSSCIASSMEMPLSDSTNSGNSRNLEESSDVPCSDCCTAQISTDNNSLYGADSKSLNNVLSDEPVLTDSDSVFSTSMSTAKENNIEINNTKVSKQAHFDIVVREETNNHENNDRNIRTYELNEYKETSPYEILEVVVSETFNGHNYKEAHVSNNNNLSIISKEGHSKPYVKFPVANQKKLQNIDLDEYVSNILVESLNSLTDQLESMNASIGNDRRISIVEKEIKVKLQNTGVNTIVHLSPTSNHQIIFGNKELYNQDDDKDSCNNIKEPIPIREEIQSAESNNNFSATPETLREDNAYLNERSLNDPNENYDSVIQSENVNKAVLQQIQKLFQDEFQNPSSQHYSPNMIPGISHIEISNVDVFIAENECDNNFKLSENITDNTMHNHNEYDSQTQDLLSGVGSGNYYDNVDDSVLVPRFSALPHSASMEVNTSSSDAEPIGSECTSLVDSLEDPNSPRTMLLRRSINKRNELVRSAIDVLDLLPESTQVNEEQSKEKSETFFIRIKDNDCDCEKENVIVADHMPEKIKQRLYRRHKKRELRMECAKRKKMRQLKREIEKENNMDVKKSKREVENECMVIVDALIDDVIFKIAKEEYQYMIIKQQSNTKENNKTSLEDKSAVHQRSIYNKDSSFKTKETYKTAKHSSINNYKDNVKGSKHNKHRQSREIHEIYGKLSLQAHPLLTPDDCGPKRVYQKSEIHDGRKCIEILEILEYVESSQSSPDLTNSYENLHCNKTKKSKIPIPICERIHKLSKNKAHKSYRSSPVLNYENNYKYQGLVSHSLVDTGSDDSNSDVNMKATPNELPARRASVPQHETRSRSNSLRFKQVFDIIPEEKSSLSVESSSEDINYNRRVSAPNITGIFSENKNSNMSNKTKVNEKSTTNTYQDSKSIGTSPLTEHFNANKNSERLRNKNVMTSPLHLSRKSVATSPIPPKVDMNQKSTMNSGKKSLSSRGTRAGWLGFYKPNKQMLEEEGIKVSCSPCH